jgi:broad specificity phosphatase PhoE
MANLRRLILIRHGETTEGSAERMIGSGDPPLSAEGEQQLRAAARTLRAQFADAIVASTQRRAWQAAQYLAPGQKIRLENDLREIDFGRWEGKRLPEIEASDPVLYKAWREGTEGFEYPGGELRAEFRKRVERGLQRIQDTDAAAALVVTHKGVIRTIIEILTGTPLDRSQPPLGGAVLLTLGANGWFLGQSSSDST